MAERLVICLTSLLTVAVAHAVFHFEISSAAAAAPVVSRSSVLFMVSIGPYDDRPLACRAVSVLHLAMPVPAVISGFNSGMPQRRL